MSWNESWNIVRQKQNDWFSKYTKKCDMPHGSIVVAKQTYARKRERKGQSESERQSVWNKNGCFIQQINLKQDGLTSVGEIVNILHSNRIENDIFRHQTISDNQQIDLTKHASTLSCNEI